MLEIKNIKKEFDSFRINDISLDVGANDYHILLGKSGSGKSLLLEIIAGITRIDSGTIFLNGTEISKLPMGKRRTGLVFQSPAIFPHLSVEQNIAYPLLKASAQEKKKIVVNLSEMMGISHLLKRKTTILSGGELQRIALARVLASKPLILLLDEPLSAIDTPMKADLRGLLYSLNNSGMPILHVTHDFEEAVALGTYISIIDNGQIIQSGSAEEVINNPKTNFSANFSGERNFFRGYINSGSAFVHDENKVTIPIKLAHSINHDKASILIRSNSITLSLVEPHSSNLNNYKGIITKINPKKEGYQVCVNIGLNIYANITSESCNKMEIAEGKDIWVSFKASSVEVIL